LENTHPELCRRLISGHFIVINWSGFFNAIASDMKLEQMIQKSSKSKSGILEQIKNLFVVIDWQLICHDNLLVTNNLREMTNDTTLEHS